MTYKCTIDTPLGAMTAAAEQGVLTGLWFVGQKYYPRQAGVWVEQPDYGVFRELRAWLGGYFSGRVEEFGVALGPRGTEFQVAVWRILRRIPAGQVTTYGAIAGELARAGRASAGSAQAVGGAVGHNPISIIIPCHRVVGAGGALTGYAGGLDKKQALLALERGGLQ